MEKEHRAEKKHRMDKTHRMEKEHRVEKEMEGDESLGGDEGMEGDEGTWERWTREKDCRRQGKGMRAMDRGDVDLSERKGTDRASGDVALRERRR